MLLGLCCTMYIVHDFWNFSTLNLDIHYIPVNPTDPNVILLQNIGCFKGEVVIDIKLL